MNFVHRLPKLFTRIIVTAVGGAEKNKAISTRKGLEKNYELNYGSYIASLSILWKSLSNVEGNRPNSQAKLAKVGYRA